MGNIGKILLAFLLVLPALAQSRKALLIAPKPSSGGGSGGLPYGIRWRLMATNLSDPVTIWTDSVSGQSWEQSTPANQPRWTNSFGVFFAPNMYLYNGAFPVPEYYSTNAILVICKFDSVGIGPVFGSSGTMAVAANGGQWYNPSAGNFGTVQTAKIYDYLITSEHIDSTLVGRIYTNGVYAKNGSGINGVKPTFIGYNGSFALQGTVYEIIVWDCATNWSASDIDAIHKYATNAYNYTP